MRYQLIGADLSGQVAAVTGANSGMGRETARELAWMGAAMVLACRDPARAEAARRDITVTTGNPKVTVLRLDLASPTSVRAFVEGFTARFPTLDVLVNSAAASLRTRQVTADGFERQWATNALGPHLLTGLLLPALEASGRGRIVTVSTIAAGGLDLADTQYETRRYSGIGAYRASKQAGRMLTWGWADRLQGRPVTANALNPGYVASHLTRNANRC